MNLITTDDREAAPQVQPGNLLRFLQSAFAPDARCQTMMCVFCFLFGLAMLANLQLTNDGGWLWYPLNYLHGQRLYADMHLALQPLFILETAAFLELFGPGWMVSKIPGVLHLIAYCVALLLLARKSNLPDRQKAVVLGCAFFVSICSIAYQFDDYHTPADCLVLYSVLLLLSLREAATLRRSVGLVVCLGVLSGLEITLRINDGVALWFGVALSILCLAPAKRFVSALLFTVVTATIAVLVVHLTGDTFHTYLQYSLFRAVSGKGGGGNVLNYPIRLPWNTFHFLLTYPGDLALIGYVFAIAASWAYLLRPLGRPRGNGDAKKDALGILIILAALWRIGLRFFSPDILLSISTFSVFAIYGLGIYVFLRYLRWEISGRTTAWDSREILLITPLGQLISTAASSGGVHWGVYEPWAMLIIVLPIASPIRFKSEQARAVFIGVATFLLIYGAVFRFTAPYIWHSTLGKTMFVGRQWYRHPVYGPMIIRADMLHFIQPICDQLGPPAPDRELLSLPYPYANYFCNIPPWHGWVQTYFDTTTPADIARLMDELQTAPPKWILYQRQLDSLVAHEKQYNHGQPLPHRYLDHFLEQKIVQGEWQVAYTSSFENEPKQSNQWILIRTRP